MKRPAVELDEAMDECANAWSKETNPSLMRSWLEVIKDASFLTKPQKSRMLHKLHLSSQKETLAEAFWGRAYFEYRASQGVPLNDVEQKALRQWTQAYYDREGQIRFANRNDVPEAYVNDLWTKVKNTALQRPAVEMPMTRKE